MDCEKTTSLRRVMSAIVTFHFQFLCSLRWNLVPVVLLLVAGTMWPSFAQDSITPDVIITDEGVQISFTTLNPSANAKLVWTDQVPEDEPFLHHFPTYLYILEDAELKRNHVFTLMFEPLANPTAQVRPLPFNREIHFRISAIVQKGGQWLHAASDDVRFRVVRDKMGRPRSGLIFTEGPAVIRTSDSEAILHWKTNIPAVSTFYYGIDSDKMIQQSSASAGDTASVQIKKLKPGAFYNYQVKCEVDGLGDSIISPLFTFRSAPKEGRDFRFAVMGGSVQNSLQLNPNMFLNGINVEVLNRCAVDAYHRGADFIIMPGNLIGGMTTNPEEALSQYQTWKRAIRGVNSFIPVYTAMGEREAKSPWREAGQTTFPEDMAESVFASVMNNPANGPDNVAGLPTYRENVYNFTYAGASFIVLNSEYNTSRGMRDDDEVGRTIDRTQRIWLRGQLEKHVRNDWVFVVFNAPAWPTANFYGVALDRLPGVRDKVWELLDNFDIDAVFNSLEPNYSHVLIDESVNAEWDSVVHQFNTGGAGILQNPTIARTPYSGAVQSMKAEFHYLLVTIDGRRAIVDTWNTSGSLIDSTTLKRKKR